MSALFWLLDELCLSRTHVTYCSGQPHVKYREHLETSWTPVLTFHMKLVKVPVSCYVYNGKIDRTVLPVLNFRFEYNLAPLTQTFFE